MACLDVENTSLRLLLWSAVKVAIMIDGQIVRALKDSYKWRKAFSERRQRVLDGCRYTHVQSSTCLRGLAQ